MNMMCAGLAPIVRAACTYSRSRRESVSARTIRPTEAQQKHAMTITLIIRLGRDLMRKHAVGSDLYAQAVRLFGKKGVVELVTVMGDYVMVGMVLTAIDQHLPADRPARLPPR